MRSAQPASELASHRSSRGQALANSLVPAAAVYRHWFWKYTIVWHDQDSVGRRFRGTAVLDSREGETEHARH